MGITVRKFLENIIADDWFHCNIKQNGERIYFGYNTDIPDDVMEMEIESVYIDWASEALGIKVR